MVEVRKVYKKDKVKGQAIASVLISEFLEACNEENFVNYKLVNADLDTMYYEVPKVEGSKMYTFKELVDNFSNYSTYEKWHSYFHYPYAPQDCKKQFKAVLDVYRRSMAVGEDVYGYFSRMITLDYIFRNKYRSYNTIGAYTPKIGGNCYVLL